MFEAFDAEVAARAKRAAQLAGQASRLTGQLKRAGEAGDLHTLRQKVGAAAERSAEASAVAAELARLCEGFRLVAPQDAEAAAGAYAAAFEQAADAGALPLEGAFPDYRVFPFDVRIRLAEERALIGRRSHWAMRPAALVEACKRERARLHGAAFAADRFGAALVRCYDLLMAEDRTADGTARPREVPLQGALTLLQLSNFGRATYTRDEFAFDLYRYRQTPMRVASSAGTRAVILDDARHFRGAVEVPNSRGGHDRLGALLVLPADADPEGGSAKDA